MSDDPMSGLRNWKHEFLSLREELYKVLDWLRRDRDAYKERVEALKKYAKHNDDCDGLRDDIYRLRGCTCGLDALLAECERRTDA